MDDFIFLMTQTKMLWMIELLYLLIMDATLLKVLDGWFYISKMLFRSTNIISNWKTPITLFLKVFLNFQYFSKKSYFDIHWKTSKFIHTTFLVKKCHEVQQDRSYYFWIYNVPYKLLSAIDWNCYYGKQIIKHCNNVDFYKLGGFVDVNAKDIKIELVIVIAIS